MENALYDLLKANIVFTTLFLIYYFFLRKEKFLIVNRVILLAIPAAVIILPLFPNLDYSGLNQNAVLFRGTHSVPQFFTTLGPQPDAGFSQTDSAVQSVNYVGYTMLVYMSVVLMLFIKLSINLLKLFRVIRKSDQRKIKGTVYCEPAEGTPPFSFFNFIVVRSSAFEKEKYHHIISHELCHCTQLHSVDILLAELSRIFLWINPLVFLYRRQLTLNLEFLADEQVLNKGADRKNYQLSLLGSAAKTPSYSLANSFHSSKIKQRISMMNREQPSFKKAYKYILLLPFLGALYLFVNAQQPKIQVNQLIFTQPGEITSFHYPGFLQERKQPEDSDNSSAPLKITAEKNILKETADNRSTDLQRQPQIFIDARTDTVKFREVINKDKKHKIFTGIYVIDGKVYSVMELRNLLKPTGKLDIILANRPVLGVYSENDENAIRQWGKQAKKGVVFIEPRKDTTSHIN